MAKDDYDFVVCLGDYIYAESYHSKADGTGVRDDHIGSASPAPGHVREAITSTTTSTSTRSTAPTRRCELSTRSSRWSCCGTTTRCRTTTRAGRPTAACRPPMRYTRARKNGGLQGVLRVDARRSGAATAMYRTLKLRQDRRAGRHGPAPVPGQPAVRRRGRPAVRRLGPAARLPRREADGLGQKLQTLEGRLEGDGQRGHDHAAKLLGGSYFTYDNWHGYPQEREELLGYIKTKRSRTSSSSPATSTRSSRAT